jgi:hypothetical protein
VDPQVLDRSYKAKGLDDSSELAERYTPLLMGVVNNRSAGAVRQVLRTECSVLQSKGYTYQHERELHRNTMYDRMITNVSPFVETHEFIALKNVVFTVTLVVLYYTLYRIRKKVWRSLILRNLHVSSFAVC